MTDDALVDQLPAWLARQRWFPGDSASDVSITEAVPLPESAGPLALRVITATSGGIERRQLLTTWSCPDPEVEAQALIARTPEGPVCEATLCHDGRAALLELLTGPVVDSGDGLRIGRTVEAELFAGTPGVPMGGEQSNTSVVHGDVAVLKVFRTLVSGVNPELELTRALATRGNVHVAAPLAWAEAVLPGDADGDPTTLMLLSAFMKGGTDGWKQAVASVRDLLAAIRQDPEVDARGAGADFASESRRIGQACASVHADLAQVLPSQAATSEDADELRAVLRDRLETAVSLAPVLAEFKPGLEKLLDGVRAPFVLQRVHGDLHLGQVMRTDAGWNLLDFEGEPGTALVERRALSCAIRDVAGMIRSLDYAAGVLLAEHSGDLDHELLAERAKDWVDRNVTAFCEGYASASGPDGAPGDDPRNQAALLAAFEMDKAVYEVVYELRHRPAWVEIPLSAVRRLAATDTATGTSDPEATSDEQSVHSDDDPATRAASMLAPTMHEETS